MSDKLGDWLEAYEQYLDGKIEYKDLPPRFPPPLPPRPAPPPPVEVMTPADAKQLVDDAAARARRTAIKFTVTAAIPLVGLTAALFVFHVPWLAILGAQWAFVLSFTKASIWYMERKDARSPERRDPTLDETSKDRE